MRSEKCKKQIFMQIHDMQCLSKAFLRKSIAYLCWFSIKLHVSLKTEIFFFFFVTISQPPAYSETSQLLDWCFLI